MGSDIVIVARGRIRARVSIMVKARLGRRLS